MAQPLRITMGDDLREDLRGALLDSADDAEPHTAGDAAPRAIRQPRLVCEAFLTCALALAQRPCGQAIPLGVAPPARAGQGKPPEARFLFRAHHDLATASPIRQGSACERSPSQGSGVGSEPPCGTTGASSFFSHVAAALAAALDPGLAGEDGSACLPTPLGLAGAGLERVVVDEASAVERQGTHHFWRSTGAGVIREALDPVVGTAVWRGLGASACLSRHGQKELPRA